MDGDGFTAFPEECVTFLRGLKANNDKAWFAGNKAVYERAIKHSAEAFCRATVDRLTALTGAAHTSKVYRLHRDLRFSKDPTPYNAHLHISFIREGEGGGGLAWLFGLEPGRLVLGVGVMAFEKATLETFRHRVAGPQGAALSAVLDRLRGAGIRIDAPELKRVPRGFDPDHAHAGLLRRKSLTVWKDFPDPMAATRPDWLDTCLSGFDQLRPVYDWLIEG